MKNNCGNCILKVAQTKTLGIVVSIRDCLYSVYLIHTPFY